jgi:hypothetical protein
MSEGSGDCEGDDASPPHDLSSAVASARLPLGSVRLSLLLPPTSYALPLLQSAASPDARTVPSTARPTVTGAPGAELRPSRAGSCAAVPCSSASVDLAQEVPAVPNLPARRTLPQVRLS